MKPPRDLDRNILKVSLDAATRAASLGISHDAAIDTAVSHVRSLQRLSVRENLWLRCWLKDELERGWKQIGPPASSDNRPSSRSYAVSDQNNVFLSSERLNYFRRSYESHKMLPPILGWLTFFAGIVLIAQTKVDIRSWWLLVFLLFLPGYLFGAIINNAGEALHKWSRQRQSDYPAYIRFEEKSRVELERKHAADAAADQERRLRKQLEEKKKRSELNWWKGHDGPRFEVEITSLLRTFGFQAQRTGRSGDGGIDIEIKHEGKRIIVQCKAQQNFISPGAVRDLYGTLIHEKANEAWLITTSGFYGGARAFAGGKPIRLLTIKEVLDGCLSD